MKKSIILMVIMLIICKFVFAQESIKIVISSGYPPYYYNVEKPVPDGFVPEIVTIIAKKINCKIEYICLPWSRCVKTMRKQEADAIYPVFLSRERAEFMYYIDDNIVSYGVMAFIVKKGAGITYNGDMNALKDYRIGILDKYHYGEKFDQADFLQKDVVVVSVTADTRLIKKLIAGRDQVIAGSPLVLFYHAKKMGVDDQLEVLTPYLTKKPVYIAFSKKKESKAKGDKFGKALKEFKTTPEYIAILEKYNAKIYE